MTEKKSQETQGQSEEIKINVEEAQPTAESTTPKRKRGRPKKETTLKTEEKKETAETELETDAIKLETEVSEELTTVTEEMPETEKAPLEAGTVFWGTGRRKTSVARVRLVPGRGRIIVNGIIFTKYFRRRLWEIAVRAPLKLTKTLGQFDVYANVSGGGLSGQADAIKLGIARALVQYKAELREKLRKAGMLTRDPRMKERKKYGQKGARKRFQWTKR